MTTSTHDSVVRRMSHTLPPTTALRMKMTHPLIYTLAPLAFVRSAPCNVPHLPKRRLSVRSSTTIMHGQLCTCLVPRRCSVFLVAWRLGSDFWLASSSQLDCTTLTIGM